MMENIHSNAVKAQKILEMHSLLVGVKFLFDPKEIPTGVRKLTAHRYCQALMKARHGEHALLDAEGINCPAAAAAFGFKELPDGLKTGKGLVGFGITLTESTGRKMFEGMARLPVGKLKALYLFPLLTASEKPDIVVAEDETEKLMWIALAYLNVTGGERIVSSTAILQATCVDVTIIPYTEQRLNVSLGCYGCRDATDIGHHETVLGFPFGYFHSIVQSLEFLGQKALSNSRKKKAFHHLQMKNTENLDQKNYNTDAINDLN